ncbi:hypothetical protein CJ030_MR4G010935 [Morella rubra]|uniref:Uncharacterized protein n=1 Tax=Morella rubra TaxID=262757 RepID=A0A6A1VSG4_9ROSI|nr:hypothetical protein CJ030_MR4G010935 [Morella rubra]
MVKPGREARTSIHEAYQGNESVSLFVYFSNFNMIPLSRHDVDPLLHVTDDTKSRRCATSISDSDDESCDDSEDSDSSEETRAAVTLANAATTTLNGANGDLPSLASVNLRGTLQSSCASTSGIIHVRIRMCGLALEKAHIARKLSVHIPDGRTGGDDKASSMLSSHIGSLMRSHAPFNVVNWSKVPNEVKSYIMNKILDDFKLDYDRPKDRNTVISIMNTAYRTHRNRMHQYYALFPTKEEALDIRTPT